MENKKYPGLMPAPAPEQEAPAEGDIPDEVRNLLTALLAGESLTDWCKRQPVRKNPQTVADHINEMAADRIGDIILESDGVSWTLIEDYREDITSWITPPPN